MSGVIYIIGDKCLSWADFALVQSCTIDIALYGYLWRESLSLECLAGRRLGYMEELRYEVTKPSSLISFTLET
jgi:hypothetical protein